MLMLKFVLFMGGLGSALVLGIAGKQMMAITSVGGDSIMEASYHAEGLALIGAAIFAFGLLAGIAFLLPDNASGEIEDAKE